MQDNVPDQNTRERFWSKVKLGAPDECWEWQGGKQKSGYGQFWLNALGRSVTAHRMAYWLEYGEWPNVCCHKCDNPGCVNPGHLYNGTAKTNAADRDPVAVSHAMKNRPATIYARGECGGGAKLAPEQVIEIRKRYQHGRRGSGLRRLAAEYGVTPNAIRCIVTHETWAHLP